MNFILIIKKKILISFLQTNVRIQKIFQIGNKYQLQADLRFVSIKILFHNIII